MAAATQGARGAQRLLLPGLASLALWALAPAPALAQKKSEPHLAPLERKGVSAFTTSSFRRRGLKEGQKISIAWVRFKGLSPKGYMLIEGGQRGGRPLRSALRNTLWAPNRVLRDRLRKNRDSQRRVLVPGGPVQIFGRVQFSKKRLYVRLQEVRKLDDLVTHFRARVKALAAKDPQVYLALASTIRRETAYFPEEREALGSSLQELKRRARELSLAQLAKTPLPGGAKRWIQAGVETREVEILARVAQHAEVPKKLRQQAEEELRTKLSAHLYLGRWYSEEAYQRALGFVLSPPELMRVQGWNRVRWVPEPLAFLSKQAEAVKRKGLVFDVSQGLRAQALAQGQIVKSMSKKEVVAACLRSLGADGAFPTRVVRYRETYKSKERVWELWVMKNGLRVVFVGGVVATKVEP